MLGIQTVLDEVVQWAIGNGGVLAVGLVGSYARGTARPDSDVDLVVLLDDPRPYLQHAHWVTRFGDVNRVEHEDWGLVQSLRVFYVGGLEVEFGLTSAEWAGTTPIDAGTRQVVSDGMQVLYDREAMLAALVAAFERS